MRTTSRWPCATRRRISASTAPALRLRDEPRTSGITQKLHENEQPSWIFTNARTRSSRASACTQPIAPTSPATNAAVSSLRRETTVTFAGSPENVSPGRFARAAREVDAAVGSRGAGGGLPALRDRLVRDAARADHRDVCARAGPTARVRSSWPSASSRSRISWTSAWETLQPRKSTLKLVTGVIVLRRLEDE